MYFVRIFRQAVIEAQGKKGLTIVSHLNMAIKIGKEKAAAANE